MRLGFVCVCVLCMHVCTFYTVYECMCPSLCVHNACRGARVGAKTDVTLLPQSLSTLVLRQHLSLDLKVTILAKLTCQ